MRQIQSNLSVGNNISLKTKFPISINNHDIDFQRKEDNGYIYTGTVRNEMPKKETIYQITLNSYIAGDLATIKVSLKEGHESVVQLNETVINNIDIVSLTTQKYMDMADGG